MDNLAGYVNVTRGLSRKNRRYASSKRIWHGVEEWACTKRKNRMPDKRIANGPHYIVGARLDLTAYNVNKLF